MDQEKLEQHAYRLLRENPTYVADAREGVRVSNSVVGSLLALQFSVPRQYAEEAVAAALALLDSGRAESTEPDGGGNYTLRRSGNAPLRFRGELLAVADGEQLWGKERDRWHEISLYRTAAGKYVLAIGYRTRWQGEADRDTVEVCADAAAAARFLQAYNPVASVAGYPPTPQYAEKQQRLLADLHQRYEALVSAILDSEEFAEIID